MMILKIIFMKIRYDKTLKYNSDKTIAAILIL